MYVTFYYFKFAQKVYAAIFAYRNEGQDRDKLPQ